jgi:hypothetical protein
MRKMGGKYKQEKVCACVHTHTLVRKQMPVSVGIVTVVAFIVGGAILFSVWEDWNVFDGAYYSFITLRYARCV